MNFTNLTADSLENQKLFNDIIRWLNTKVAKECKLYERKVISFNEYSFMSYIGPLKYTNNDEVDSYYFKLGQLLSILYILSYENSNEGNIVKDILNSSVYKIDFLPNSKKYLLQEHLELIKQGFKYMYNVMVNNKIELIKILEKLFSRNHLCLSKIMPKVYGLNEEDLKRQLYFLDIRFSEKKDEKTNIKFSCDASFSDFDKEYFITLAIKLGDYIVQKGIIGFKGFIQSRSWINTISDEGRYRLSAECNNLYEGNSGIALFLLYLGTITKKDYFINTAVEAMQGSIEHLNNLDIKVLISKGFYKDVTGEVYVLSKLYTITKNYKIKEVIEKFITSVDSQIKVSNRVYPFEGLVGLMVLLIAIYENEDFIDLRNKVIELSCLVYESIKADIKEIKNSSNFFLESYLLVGVLAKLSLITANKKIKDTVEEILSYQRNKKIEYEINVYKRILLSRLMIKESKYEDDIINLEIKEALDFVIKKGFGNNPYHHNGDLESLEILEYASKVLNDHSLKRRCNNTFEQILQKIIEPYINDEISLGNKSLALMTGVTGQGYNLIRKCNELLVPMLKADF